MSDPERDSEAMQRLQQGDDLALNEIMARWQQPLASFILRYTGVEAEAVDLAQETFVRVYENRYRYKSGSKFSTWLFAIAINLCRNLARWKTRHPTTELEDAHRDTAPTPHDAAARSETAVLVRRAVLDLPHELRVTLLLFEYEDRNYAEIAAMLGCSAKAVETRLYRARKILRDRLSAVLK